MCLRSEFLPVLVPVTDSVYPLIEPPLCILLHLADLIPLHVKLVVAIIVALGIRRMAGEWNLAYGIDDQAGDQRAIWIRPDDCLVNDLLGCQDHLVSCKGSLFLLADDPPKMSIAVGVGPLHVDDGNVRLQGRHGDQDPCRRMDPAAT